jgi:hypothetical protein
MPDRNPTSTKFRTLTKFVNLFLRNLAVFEIFLDIILHAPYYPDRQPWLGRLWQVLALFLVQNCPPEAAAASAASSRAALMEQRAGITSSWRVVDKMRDHTSLLGLLRDYINKKCASCIVTGEYISPDLLAS